MLLLLLALVPISHAWVNKSTVPFFPKHKLWRQGYIDRTFVLYTIHPRIHQLAGLDGNVLEVGYNDYNVEDCLSANVSCERWHFVDSDYDKSEFHKDAEKLKMFSGHFLKSSFEALSPNWNHKFDVIFDYGVLGFQGHSWHEDKVRKYVDTYQKLLAPGGHVLLKVDGNAHLFRFWPDVTKILGQSLVPLHQHIQVASSCPDPAKARFASLVDSKLLQVTVDTNYNKHRNKWGEKCGSALYSEWYYPGNLYAA